MSSSKRDPWNSIFYDDLGLIVQRDGDGGDTAHREGWIWFAAWYHEHVLGKRPNWLPALSLQETLQLLESGATGEFRRHPAQDGFDDPDRFSRDQLIPLIAAMGVFGDRERLLRSRAAIRRCYLVAQCVQGTADIVSPELVNHYRRALGEAPDPTFDGQFVGGVALRLQVTTANPENVGDDLNMLIYLIMAHAFAPTKNSERALRAWLSGRPSNAGCYLTNYRISFPDDLASDEATMVARINEGIAEGWRPDCHPTLGALRWYFRYEARGSPLLAEIYAPIIESLLRETQDVSLDDSDLLWPNL